MVNFRALLIGLSLSLVLPAAVVRAQSWKDNLVSALAASIEPTRTTVGDSRITEYGTPLTVQMEGISASPATSSTFLLTHVRDGQIQQAKGLAAFIVNKKDARDLQVGEKVYLTDLELKDKEINIRLVSSEVTPLIVEGSTQQTRYMAAVRFDFPKGYLAAAMPDSVLAAISQVLKIEGIQADAPRTVELGQTPEEVEVAFGKPDKILKLGDKTIYVYEDVKVTFTDGKITDVQ